MLSTMLAMLENEPLKINSSLCPHQKTNRYSCNLCAETCPVQGLKWQDNNWVSNKCNHCGKCVSVCPARVFDLDTDQLLSEKHENGSLIITCFEYSKDLPLEIKSELLSINCFNQLYPELLAYLLGNNNRLIFFIDQEFCSGCLQFKMDSVSQGLSKYGDFVNRIETLSDVNQLESIIPSSNRKTESSISRRDFFRLMLNKGRVASQETITEKLSEYTGALTGEAPVVSDAYTITHKTSKRRILLNGLNELHTKCLPADFQEYMPFDQISVESCIFCGVCTCLCPTQALKIVADDNSKSLQISLADCMGCGLCQTVCLFGHIKSGGHVRLNEFLQDKPAILASARMQECKKCGSHFYHYPDTEELCQECKNPKKLDSWL